MDYDARRFLVVPKMDPSAPTTSGEALLLTAFHKSVLNLSSLSRALGKCGRKTCGKPSLRPAAHGVVTIRCWLILCWPRSPVLACSLLVPLVDVGSHMSLAHVVLRLGGGEIIGIELTVPTSA